MSLDTPAGHAVIEAGADALWPGPSVRDDLSADAKAVLTAALAVRVPCETCGGSGDYRYVDDPCPDCDGSGAVSALRVLLDETGTNTHEPGCDDDDCDLCSAREGD